MKLIQSIWFICTAVLVLVFMGCLSLDPFLFKGEKVTNYSLDAYTGEVECADAIAFLNANGYTKPVTKEIALTSGNEIIYAILLQDSIPIDPTDTIQDTIILYLHGTGPHIDYYWPRARLLFALGYPVMTLDYRGYGKSTGEATEAGIFEDGAVALRYIRDTLGIGSSVIIYSFSLGSLVGCDVTAADFQNQIIQIILEAPIGSIETLVQDASFLNIPGSYVTTYTADNREKIKLVSVPLLWIHGTRDETINRETNGLRVWNNHPSQLPGYYIKVEGGGHRTNPQTISYTRYIICCKDFIQNNSNKDPLLISK